MKIYDMTPCRAETIRLETKGLNYPAVLVKVGKSLTFWKTFDC